MTKNLIENIKSNKIRNRSISNKIFNEFYEYKERRREEE